MSNSLPVSQLIQVSVTLTPAGAQAQNLNALLILGSSTVLDTVERYRPYTTLAAVAADFGTVAPEYLAANLYFQQAPQPTKLWIGRWLQTAAAGVLRCAPLSAANQLMSVWTAISAGSFSIALNGGGSVNVTGLNFSGAANLAAVAAIIQTATAGATVVWNSVYQRFEFTSATTGATSSVSFLSTTGSGTDISSLIGGRSTSSGAYVAPGLAAETAVSAVTLFDQNYGQAWYALTVLGAADSDHLLIAPYIEGANNKHVYIVSTQEAGCLVASSTTDIAYLLSQLAFNKTMTQYSSSTPYAGCSLAGRFLTVDYTGNNTAITLAYKQEPGIVPEYLSTPQAAALSAKNCNAFLEFNNNTAIILNGVVASGSFIDITTGTDWLAVTLMTAMYNLLYTSTTKVPQTDAGMNLLLTTAESICAQGVVNGLLAPGVWNSGGFGILHQGDFLPKGFYVYAPPVASQAANLRALRISVPIQIACKLAGAIHDISISVSVNQ